jgi:endonuclease I
MKKIIISAFIVFVSIVFVSCSLDTSETTIDLSTEDVTTNLHTETTNNITSGTTETFTTVESTTNSIITTTEKSIVGIELKSNSKEFYYQNEEFQTQSLILVEKYSDGSEIVIDNEEISVKNFSSDKIGVRTIFITYQKYLIETKITILADYAFPIYMEYYQEAINIEGDFLHITLNNIIHENFNPLLYGDARYILDESDIDPSNEDNLILVYLGTSVSSNWDGGTTWNREHVWPQSRLGVYVEYGDDDYPSKATDIHNLKPADPDENGFRSNDYFDWTKTSDTYEPRDEVKGDIARILFYMATMYFDLKLNDDPTTISSFKTMGNLSVLLEWNELDPVDDFEKNRNEVIYSYQGNRNPFIDYPEFANLIWGNN